MEAGVTDLALHADGLVVERGGARVLDRVSLSVRPGEWVDLRGPSGGGKSTLLQALARLLPLGAGTLRARSVPAEGAVETWRRCIAYVAQQPVALPGTVGENLRRAFSLRVASGAPAPDDSRLRDALDRLGLDGVDLGRAASELSGGQLARLALLRARLTAPDVLLLDEPDAMLDGVAAERVEAEIRRHREGGGAVVRASHHAAHGADRTLTVEGGEIRS